MIFEILRSRQTQTTTLVKYLMAVLSVTGQVNPLLRGSGLNRKSNRMQPSQLRAIFRAVQRLLSQLRWWQCSIPILMLSSLSGHNSFAQQPIDAGLYTSHNFFDHNKKISWVVCGSLPGSSGCFSSGDLGPFSKVGALLEDNPSTNLGTQTVTRYIYVLDIAAGTNLNGVELYIYKKTDVISATYDHATVTLSDKVSLPLIGGATAIASMAGNVNYLFIGTTESPQAVEVTKSTLALTQVGGFSPPLNVHAVTADAYGYITVEFGKFGGSPTGNYVFGPDGTVQGDGGGTSFMLNTMQAVVPSELK